jgi:hypothetical protein
VIHYVSTHYSKNLSVFVIFRPQKQVFNLFDDKLDLVRILLKFIQDLSQARGCRVRNLTKWVLTVAEEERHNLVIHGL